MGITHFESTATGPTGGSAVVSFLLDSGATDSLLNKDTWQAIGLEPKRAASVNLGDGRPRTGTSRCFGSAMLEILGVVFNPFNRALQPMRTVLV